jgi:aspartyl-tRNA(Asn)/glutamyl-tRNA(Gln) amidotransferase subunit A
VAGDDVIAFLSSAALTERYRKRALSPVETALLPLARLDALQPKLDAFCIVAAAGTSEERWRRGEPLGPLDGIPVTIKDLMLMRGFPTLRGSHLVDPDQDWYFADWGRYGSQSESQSGLRLRDGAGPRTY